MRLRATTIPAGVLAGLGLLGLAGCMGELGTAGQPAPVPPPSAEQDRSAYNNQQVALFVTRDAGWQAWLNAVRSSDRANDALVDASRYNTPVANVIQAITVAQGTYKAATSFRLPPFTVTSGCLDLPPETGGHVQLSDGLTVRYGFLMSRTTYFANGSSCRVSVGLVDEIDSSRGLPVVTADRGMPIDWGASFSRYLVWHQPYWKISTGTTLSPSDLVDLIER